MQTTFPENFTKQLQRLLVLVSDNYKHYQQAVEKVHSAEFRELFKHFAEERLLIIDELKKRISSVGATPDDQHHGLFSGLAKTWQNLRASAGGSGDQEILGSCRNSDVAVLDGYDEVLQGAVLEDPDLKMFLSAQRFTINESFLQLERRYFEMFKSDNSADYL